MADQKETYGYVATNKGGTAHAADLFIVGIDCTEEDRPELYDPQRLKEKVDEGLVRSIMSAGVRLPVGIKTFRGDENVYVVDGRQRVLATREANKRRGDAEEILVPCYVVKDDAIATFIIGNRFRRENSVLADALTAARLRAHGHDDAKIAAYYGVSRSLLTTLWWPLADASPAIQKAVEAKNIAATVGAGIAGLPAKDQAGALRDAIAEGKGSAALENVRAKKRAVANGRDASSASRRLSTKQLKTFAESLETHAQDEDPANVETLRVAHAVLWAIGGKGPDILDLWPILADRFRAVISPPEPVEADELREATA